MKTPYLILLIFHALIISTARAQQPGSAGLPFLTIQPSPRAQGMGGTSVAYTGNDALAIAFNPAQLGPLSLNHRFAFELYPGSTQWLPQLASDLTYDAKALLLGYPFKRQDQNPTLSFGFSFSRVFLDFGEITISDESSPDQSTTYHAFDRANVWSLGVGFDDLVKGGVGFSFKDIQSNLVPSSFGGDGSASANAFDFGALAYVPVEEIIARLKQRPFEISSGLRPFAGIGFGYSQSNIGDEIVYIDEFPADPLPRTARVGTSLKIGLALSEHEQAWRVLSFEHVHESEQLLLRLDENGDVTYAGWLGDIDFWDNVILRKAGPEITSKSGWELNLGEIVSIRHGRYDDPLGQLSYDTEGIGFNLHGVLKMIRHFNPASREEAWLKFMYDHIDLSYTASSLKGNLLTGTELQSIRFSIF